MGKLLVEIGNTALKAAFAEGLTLGKTFRYQGERMIEYVCNLCAESRPEMLVVSSVKILPREDAEALEKASGRLILLDPSNTAVLKAYGFPGYLTYDRAAGMIAARRLFPGKECVVFDLGTTLTVDFLGSGGEYLGGNVSPGCRTRFKALNRYSKALPLVNTPLCESEKGTTLVGSIESGVVSGIIFEIEGYLSRTPGSVAVLTGGDADYFASRTKYPTFVVANIVLMGLCSIAEDYDEKNNC